MTKKESIQTPILSKLARQQTRAAKVLEREANFRVRVEEELHKRLTAHLAQHEAEQQLLIQRSVVGQVKMALRRENILPMMCGFILGGFIPIATFLIVHWDLPKINFSGPIASVIFRLLEVLLVGGGLVFSAKTCVAWTHQAFQDRTKAIAWVILLEGVMILSPIQQLASIGLAILVAINGIATGCNLALNRS